MGESGKRRRPRIFLIIAACEAIFMSLLLAAVFPDLLEHAVAYLFLAFLAIIGGITGLAGGILTLIRGRCREAGRVLLRCFSFILIIFSLYIGTLDARGIENFWFVLAVATIPYFVLLGIRPVRRCAVGEDPFAPPPGGRLSVRVGLPIILYIAGAAAALLATWTIDWNRYVESIRLPGGSGISYYRNSSGEPSLLVNVRGGFIQDVRDDYRGNPGYPETPHRDEGIIGITAEITVRAMGPETEIDLSSWAGERVRLFVLNAPPEDWEYLVNGEEVIPDASAGSDYWAALAAREKQGGEEIQAELEIQGGGFITSRKGCFVDVNLPPGQPATVTLHRRPDKAPLRFIALSDTHSGYGVFAREMRGILDADADFLIWNGDIVNNGYPVEYAINGSFIDSLPVPVYTTIGNHDIWTSGEDYYYRWFGPVRYSFEWKDCLFVFLDSSRGLLGADQFEWLRSELAGSEATWKVVSAHIPPIDTVLGGFDDSELQFPEMRHNLFSLSESDWLIGIMEEYSVDLFIGGHTHEHGITETAGGVTIVTSGALGGTVGPGDNVGYLEIREEGGRLVPRHIDVMEPEEVAEGGLDNASRAARVFLLSFIIERSVALALSFLLLPALALLWLPVKRRAIFREENNG